jgi:hypothetical protein
MSLMQFNNLSLLTYGALGLTGVALAIASVYETSGSPATEEASVFSSAPAEPESSGLLGSESKEEAGLFGSESKEDAGLFGSESKPAEGTGMFGTERVGGKKSKRGTKKNKSHKKGGSKKSRKTKHRKQKKSKQQQKSA